jgi:ABC-type uncharacterized transport system ATPase subunit
MARLTSEHPLYVTDHCLGDRGTVAVQGQSALIAGDIFGIAGVDGNGRRVVEVIAGQRPGYQGTD